MVILISIIFRTAEVEGDVLKKENKLWKLKFFYKTEYIWHCSKWITYKMPSIYKMNEWKTKELNSLLRKMTVNTIQKNFLNYTYRKTEGESAFCGVGE